MENTKPHFLQLSPADRKAAVEALIFASEEPISDKMLMSILNRGDMPKEMAEPVPTDDFFDTETPEEPTENKDELLTIDNIHEFIDEINKDLAMTGRPFCIVLAGGGWQFSTRKEYGELINNIFKAKTKRRLSQASLEVLSIIAYRQPVTKPEIEQIRGVNSGDIVNSLIEKGLVDCLGRKDALGKPLIFGTTGLFLKTFGINSLEDLPKLKELEDLGEFLSPDKENIEIRVDKEVFDEIAGNNDFESDSFITIEQAEMLDDEL